MTYGEKVYNGLLDTVSKNPDKFFMNKSTYRGKNIVVSSYALTIPNDFGTTPYALESRGSVFVVDDNDKFEKLITLPFEKFFNIHEFGYDGSADLHETVKNRYGISESTPESVQALAERNDTVWMEKLDGSIITFFDWYGELDAKSNSSLTSDYKVEAFSLLDGELKEQIEKATSLGWSVMVEYTSTNPYRQIVVPYSETKLTVTGCRYHDDGRYMPYDEMVSFFGSENVVQKVDSIKSVDDAYKKENIEGYVFWNEATDFRGKLKTTWYLERHRVKESILTPSHVWLLYLDNKIDDVRQMVPTSSVDNFERYVENSHQLFSEIVNDGIAKFNNNKHLDKPSFFKTVVSTNDFKDGLSCMIARNLYLGRSVSECVEKLNEDVRIKRKISKLGIPLW